MGKAMVMIVAVAGQLEALLLDQLRQHDSERRRRLSLAQLGRHGAARAAIGCRPTCHRRAIVGLGGDDRLRRPSGWLRTRALADAAPGG
jgi:hypothetical protein